MPHWNDQVDLFLPDVLAAKDRPLPSAAPALFDDALTLAVFVDGALYFARTGGQKEAMLFELAARSPFMIAAWHGQWRTDMFTVPNELWQRCLADLEARRRKKPKRS